MAKHKHLKHKISVVGGGVLAVLAFMLILSTTSTTPKQNYLAQTPPPGGDMSGTPPPSGQTPPPGGDMSGTPPPSGQTPPPSGQTPPPSGQTPPPSGQTPPPPSGTTTTGGQPGSYNPGQPGSYNPGQPGSYNPGQPGSYNPGQPSGMNTEEMKKGCETAKGTWNGTYCVMPGQTGPQGGNTQGNQMNVEEMKKNCAQGGGTWKSDPNGYGSGYCENKGQGNYPGMMNNQAGSQGMPMNEEMCKKQNGTWTKKDPSGREMPQAYCQFGSTQGGNYNMPNGMNGQPNGMNGQPNGMNGQPNGMNGQPNGMNGQPNGMNGQPNGKYNMPGGDMNNGQFNGQQTMTMPTDTQNGMMGGEEGQCGQNMVWVEDFGRCEPVMSEKQKAREIKDITNQLKNNPASQGQPWLNDAAREVSKLFGLKFDRKSMNATEFITKNLPANSKASQAFAELTSGGDDGAQCFIDVQTQLEALSAEQNVTNQAFNDLRTNLGECYQDMQGNGPSDPSLFFQALRPLYMCRDVSQRLDDFVKHELGRFQKEQSRMGQDMGEEFQAQVEAYVADYQKKIDEFKTQISSGECEDAMMQMDDLQRGLWEGFQEQMPDLQAARDAKGFSQELNEYIAPAVEDAQKKLQEQDPDEYARVEDSFNEFFSLKDQFNAAVENGDFEAARGVMEQFQGLEGTLKRYVGDDSQAFDGSRKFDQLKGNLVGEDLDAVVAEKLNAALAAIEKKYSAALDQISSRLEEVSAALTAVTEKMSNLTANLDKIGVNSAAIEKKNTELTTNLAQFSADIQNKALGENQVIISQENSLTEALAEKEAELDKSTQKAMTDAFAALAAEPIVGEVKDKVVTALQDLQDNLATTGEAPTAADFKEIQALVNDKVSLTESQYDAGILPARDVGGVNDWIAPKVSELGSAEIAGQSVAVVKGDMVNGKPTGTFRPGDALNNAEAAKVIYTIANAVAPDKIDETTPSDESTKYNVDSKVWFAPAYNALGKEVELGSPSEPMTRGEFIKNVAEMLNVDMTPYQNPTQEQVGKDVKTNGEWGPYAAWARDNKIMMGQANGEMTLDKSVNRAEGAALTGNIVEYVNANLNEIKQDLGETK